MIKMMQELILCKESERLVIQSINVKVERRIACSSGDETAAWEKAALDTNKTNGYEQMQAGNQKSVSSHEINGV